MWMTNASSWPTRCSASSALFSAACSLASGSLHQEECSRPRTAVAGWTLTMHGQTLTSCTKLS